MTPEHMKTTPEDIDLDRMKDDTISRQAVIDLLKQMRKDGDMVPWEGKDVFARIRKLPSAQPEPSEITDEQAILHLQSTGWMQNHDREMYESGLRERLADDSEDYNSLIPCEDTISIQAAIDAVSDCGICIQRIVDLPSVQPERRKGRWRKGVCECGYDWAKDAPISNVPNFCPNCGSDMRIRGEQNG